jgi:uncharacterized protein YjcR
MPVKPNRKVAIAKRREQVADLYVKGCTQVAIAEKLSLSQATISYDLKFIQQKWKESCVRDFDLARQRELEKLDKLEREAWAAWERSQRPSQGATVREGKPGANGTTTKAMKQRDGDPRFLDVIHRCITSRRALLGLDLQEQAPITHATQINLGVSLDERRRDLLEIIDQLRQRTGLGGDGATISLAQPADLCADCEPGEVEAGETPRLLGPSDPDGDRRVE